MSHFVLLLMMLAALSVDADALEAPKLSFGGQVRARGEATSIESYAAAGKRRGMDQGLLRTRLWAEAETHRDIKAYLQLQDSRVFGTEASVVANSANTDLHQGYLDLLQLGGVPLDLRAGRMELQYGDQRLVSPLDWSNVGRAWDGARLRYRAGKAFFDAFAANVKEVANAKRDQLFWGFYSSCKAVEKHEIDLYLLGRDFGDGSQTAEQGNKGNLSDRTLGARFKGTPGAWDYTGEADWQFGRKAGQSVRAWAAALTGGYTFDAPFKPRAGLEYDYASGDSNPGDNHIQTFDPLFPFAHAYQGYADIFSWKNGHDIKASASAKVFRGWKVQGDYHRFILDHSFDGWYDAAGTVIARDAAGGSGRVVGDELDLTLRGKFRDTLDVWLGYSRFIAGEFVKKTVGGQGRDWFFLQAALDF